MKIDPLDAHDRLLHFKRDQEENLFQGVDDCLRKNKDCVSMQEYFPYVYIFAHPRTMEDGATKKMFWQPRLTKPKAQTNSYLFRAISKTDIVEIIWLLPPRELWEQYEEGKIASNEDIRTSIFNFINHRELLEAPHEEDFTENRLKSLLMKINEGKKTNKFQMIR